MAHIVQSRAAGVAVPPVTSVAHIRDFFPLLFTLLHSIFRKSYMLAASWNTLCLLAPWLIFGALIAGLMHVALPADWLRRKLVGTAGIFKAVGLGVPLPLCSCGVIPTGIGLKRNGASDGSAIGFLISTPQTGVDSVLVSASFFGWPFAIFKMILAAVTGVVGGLLAQDTETNVDAVATGALGHHSHGHSDPATPNRNWFARLIEHAIEVIQSIWVWLVVGILISAAISVWIVPHDSFQKLGDSGLLPSLLLMLVISLPLYVCATASVPIAAALVVGGMPTAAALVFLIAGPATNFATIGAIFSQFGLRNTIVYLSTIIAGSIVGALLFDWAFGTTVVSATGHHHEHLNWVSIASGILLLGFFGWFLILEVRTRLDRRSYRQTRNRSSESLLDSDSSAATYSVQGMNCQNCVNKIESTLRKTPGVDFAQVDLASETVVVEGNIQPDTIRHVIKGIGFVVPE